MAVFGGRRDLIHRLRQAGQLLPDDPPVLIVLDSGYDVVRLTWLLADLPVHLLGRIRADRVMYGRPGPRRGERPGRQPRHGQQFTFADPSTHHPAERETTSTHDRFGAAGAHAWGRLHPTPARRGTWAEHAGQLPIVEGTIIHVAVDHLPGDRAPKPLWLWFSHPDAATVELTLLWRTYLRRFDIEHTFRFSRRHWVSPAPGRAHPSRPTGGHG